MFKGTRTIPFALAATMIVVGNARAQVGEAASPPAPGPAEIQARVEAEVARRLAEIEKEKELAALKEQIKAMQEQIAAGTRPAQPGPAAQPAAAMSPAEVEAEVARRLAEIEKQKELDALKEQIKAMQGQIAAGAASVKQDAAVQQSSATTTNSQVATGPVAGVRYQLPAQWAGTAAGYVVNYGGYNYLVGSDGTMTYYTGQVYTPTQTTQTAQTTTALVDPTPNYVVVPGGGYVVRGTSSTSMGGPTTRVIEVVPGGYGPSRPPYGGGYGPRSSGNLDRLRDIELLRAQQQQLLLGRDIANGINTFIQAVD